MLVLPDVGAPVPSYQVIRFLVASARSRVYAT
jgi:hypothetical protein